MKKSAVLVLIILSLFYFAAEAQSALGKGSPQFRAIGGVSMGAYGAMNIGLGRPGFFNTIASLGGPLDMAYLLKFIEGDMLGNYDNPSAYPNRDTLLNMLKDLTISFGNPVYYNPLSTYYPPGITAQNARVPTTLFNFKDDLNPYGRLPVITFEDPAPGDWVEVLLALDSNENRKRDSGEPILRRFQEAFTDTNRNAIYDPGEPFGDTGLDGVPGTRDSGEDDGEFTYNPNHDNFFAEDPLSRAYSLSFADLQGLNLYIDAGTEDEFQFDIHADNFVDTLNDRGLVFRSENGFPVDFPRISHFNEERVYVRYPGGHVGFDKENIGLSFEQAKQGIEEAIVIANRFTTLFSFISDHFTGGDFGTNPLELLLYPSEMGVAYFTSPSLNRAMKFGIYLPPGYSRSRTEYYPVFYLLLGYNMSVDGMTNSWIKTVLDGLILTGEMQKMIIVIPDGLNYKNQRGHFFVNQIDQERGDKFKDYFFDLVTFIDTYYKTKSLEQIPTSISPTSQNFGREGGSGVVNVTTDLSWTASTNSGSWDWIGISSGWNGTGNGTVNYFVLANNTGSSRSGYLTIAGQTFNITQQAQQGACTYSILPTSNTLGPGAGSGSVNVTAGANCSWTASTNSGSWDWIAITSGWNGIGNGEVNYLVLPNNTGSSRSGYLTIAGQTFNITQQAQQGACTYSILPTSNTLGPGAGSGSVNVTAGANCSWTASTNSGSWDWIAITSGWNGIGNGEVNYLVLPNNTGSSRSGYLTIAGQTFNITQQAQQGACTYSILPTSNTLGPGAGSESVNVTAGANCSWTASTNSGSWDWIAITSGWNGIGNGEVNYLVLPNNTGSSRSGYLTIAGQTFTITQAAQ